MSDSYRIMSALKRVGTVIVLVLAGSGVAGSDDRVVKRLNVLGTAIVHEKNLADGRQNAVDDALASAVGQVVMEMLTGDTVLRRFQLINDNILTERDTYIQNYRVLTESTSGVTIRVLVQADIAADRISRDLARLGLASAGTIYPKILLMTAEKSITDAEWTYWWGENRVHGRTISERAMASALQESGFEVIDPPNLDSPLGLSVDAAETDLLTLAKQLGADVLIAGSAGATAASNTMGGSVQAFEALAEAQAFEVRTGRTIGRTRQKSVSSDQDAAKGGHEALSGAGSLAGQELGRQIFAAWQQNQDRGATVEVVVEGTGGNIASFVRLRTAISSLSGVKELKMEAMSVERAVMAVDYQGSSRSLADALLLKTFSGFGIDIFEVDSDTVRIRLVSQ